MPATRKRAGDLTGIRTQELTREHQEELLKKQEQITMLQAVENAEKEKPVDLSGPATEVVDGVPIKRPKIRVKALETVEATIGKGNFYELEEGRTYDLPENVAEHLQRKGLVWY